MGKERNEDWTIDASCAFDVVDGEFVVVTADASDERAYRPLCALLDRVRRAFGIEAAFIAHWAGGAPIVHRAGDEDEDLQAGLQALEELYGRLVLDAQAENGGGGAPVRFESVPVITDGLEYGMLCGRRILTDATASEPPALRSVARLISRWFEEADLSLSGLMPLRGESVMGALSMTTY
jgi:hypothetical protein